MIDKKIKELMKLTDEFLFIEYYSHTGVLMYKIHNEYTGYKEEKWVLCPVSEGIEQALGLAITQIALSKKLFEDES